MRLPRALAASAACLLATTGFVSPDDSGRDDFTAEVVKGDLPIQVELSGVFVAEDKDEIAMEPKTYRGDLIVTKLLPEGSEVRAGDVLMEFDEATLERSLEDARNEVADAQVALEKARADLEGFEIESTSKVSNLTTELRMAKQALLASEEKAQLELEEQEHGIVEIEVRLKDANIDFEQLIQLYEERELHTATETILIEREKRRIADIERQLARKKREVEIWKKYEQNIDVETKGLEVSKKQAELSKTEVELGGQKGEKQSEVNKAERALKKAEREVGELEEDSSGLRVVAPRDGILFYGTIGSDSPNDIVIMGFGMNEEMRIGGRVRTHQILMTVASMDNLSVRMSALENDIQHMKAGLQITVIPDAFPSLKLMGELTEVDQVAQRKGFLSEVREFTVNGKYEGVYKQLRSGMNCRVTVHANTVPDAVQVPVVAVFSEGGDHYCLVREGGKDVRRVVKLGASNGSVVQVTEGLRPGEIVSLYDPKGDAR